MSYATGTATNMADLLAQFQGACTAAGWTLAGSVLHRGDCYASLVAGTDALTLTGGNGIDGANALIDPSESVYFHDITYGIGSSDGWEWPATYFCFTFATETYLVARIQSDAYVVLGFGASPMAGVAGTGNWITSVFGTNSSTSSYPYIFWDHGRYLYQGSAACLFSYSINDSASNWNAYIHVDPDGTGAGWQAALAQPFTNWLSAAQPNAWNSESALVPIQPGHFAPENTMRFIGAPLTHARYVRIDNLAPEQVVTIGQDRWMIFPWWRKNAAERNRGIVSGGHLYTGTFGYAFRYDGP